MPIKSIFARQIFDSRGNPTVEVDLTTDLGLFRAAVPSGASTEEGIDLAALAKLFKKGAEKGGKKGKGKEKKEAKGKQDKKGKGKKGKAGPDKEITGVLTKCPEPIPPKISIHEALELRDDDKANYHGKSVMKAIGNINNCIAPELIKQNFEVTQQAEIDDYMIALDGTENKSKLGANAILGVSLAIAKAGAAKRGIPLYKHIADLAGNKDIVLPVPAFNVINGGSHAGNKLAMQEFMILPTGANTFSEAMKMGSEVYHHLKNIIKNQFGLDSTAVGDEGGFAPNLEKPKAALTLIQDAIKKAGYEGRITIGMDVAASEFFKDNKYDLDFKNPASDKSKWLTQEKLKNTYLEFIKEFPIVSIEDPFDQDDWDSWSALTCATDIQIVGDDLTVTNPKRIQEAVDKRACNCLLLKVNQIGTVTESIRAHLMAKANGWGTMVSHRSGETEDTFIADLVVGLSTGQIKTGAPCRSERLAKYNQILRIEEELGECAKYAGKAFRRPN